MGKKLSEMTFEELWQLFPIILKEHCREWAKLYGDMSVLLKGKLSDCNLVRISHIGSTAVEGIWAKPIIDILVEIASDENMSVISEIITDCGFIKMLESERRMSFNHGYTESGLDEKIYHLHLRYVGDNDRLYFRGYLNDNPNIAREYEWLKLNLWCQYEHNRDSYTEAKTEFIKKYTEYAKSQYGDRY